MEIFHQIIYIIFLLQNFQKMRKRFWHKIFSVFSEWGNSVWLQMPKIRKLFQKKNGS